MTQFKYRSYVPEDIPFIHSSWGTSYYKGAGYKKVVSPQEFHKKHRPLRDKILDSSNSTIVVVCAETDPTLIVGWAAVERPEDEDLMLIHYIYVKQAFESLGIAKTLIEKMVKTNAIITTHLTPCAEKILRTKKIRYLFVPHLI